MVFTANYLDFFDLLVNELVGDIWLFLLVSILFVYFIGMKFRIPYQAQLLLGVLWVNIIFAKVFRQVLIAQMFLILFVGTIFYFALARLIRRG